jgi:hypothetical protein
MYVGANDGGIWKTTNWLDSNPSWVPLTDKPNIFSLAVHEHDLAVAPASASTAPSIVLAAASGPGGGIMRSDDAGSTWSFFANSEFDLAEFGALVVDPGVASAQTLYVAVSAGSVATTEVSGPVAGGVYKSTNGGVTWTNTTASFHAGYASDLLEIQESGQNVLYAGLTGTASGQGAGTAGIYRSVDGGANWKPTILPLNTSIGRTIRLAGGTQVPGSTGSGERIYATILDTMNDPSEGVHRFASPGGATGSWTQLPDLPTKQQRYRHIVLAVDPANSNIIYENIDFAGNHTIDETMVKSTDGGQTFQSWPDPKNPGQVDDPVSGTFDGTGAFVLTGDNAIQRFNVTPPTPTLDRLSGNLNINQFYTFSLDPSNPLFAYGTGQDYPGTLDYLAPNSWYYSAPFNAAESGKMRVDPTNSARVYYLNPIDDPDGTGSHNDRFQHSDDYGTHWVPAVTGLPTITVNGVVITDEAYAQKNALVIDPKNPQRLLLGLHSVFETTTGGDSVNGLYGWRDLGLDLDMNGPPISAITLDPSAPNTVYAGIGDGRVFRTLEVNSTIPIWTEVDAGLPLSKGQCVMDLQPDGNSGIIFAVTSALIGRDAPAPDLRAFPHVWYLFGDHWIPINGDLPTELGGDSLAVDARLNENMPVLYLGTQRGVYMTTDENHWTLMDSLPRTRVTDLDFAPDLNLLGAGTLGRGAYMMTVDAPAPKAFQLVPPTAPEGSGDVTLTIVGANFFYQILTQNSVVQINGKDVDTTFVDANHLQVQFDAALLAEEGSFQITVTTSGPGGGVTSPLTFTVVDQPVVATAAVFGAQFGTALTNQIVATFVDKGGPENAKTDYQATIDWGDGSGAMVGDVSGPDKKGLFTVQGSHTYFATGKFPLKVTLHHDKVVPDAVVTRNVQVTVGSVIVLPSGGTVHVNGPFTLSGSFLDSARTTHGVTIDWGDETSTVLDLVAGVLSFEDVPHRYTQVPAGGMADITVTVIDVYGGSTQTTTRVHITLTPALSGPGDAVRGQLRTYMLGTTSNVSGAVTCLLNWGDGQTETITGPEGSKASHVYQETGSYIVGLSVEQSGVTSVVVTKAVEVSAWAVQTDPVDGKRDLVVGSGAHDSEMAIGRADEPHGQSGLNVAILDRRTRRQELDVDVPGPIDRILLFGQRSDKLTVSNDVKIDAIVHAGSGDSILQGGGGNNALIGGAGNDLLSGGSGRDILIGGLGSDVLAAGADQDILIGGATSYDHNDEALFYLMKEWGRKDANYATRVAHILGQSAGGLNGNYDLNGDSVQNDAVIDWLNGGSGKDLYFAFAGDHVTGLKPGEVLINH